MGIRGRWALLGGGVLLAVAGGIAWLAWPNGNTSPAEPDSAEIKASAQARIDASVTAGRKLRLAILQAGQTPSQELCDDLWDRKDEAEQAGLMQSAWLAGCVEEPESP
ncbi:hypothetical protein [Streptomyces sp. NBC_01262]|uniref:hypothetical protein n=1 Tax=Streptomyces sp. NBC_01262 TaxID=2903803 RepID=UPI002E3765BF|nr:hypothetical protein [Streptomyces sp. NBC_01262]